MRQAWRSPGTIVARPVLRRPVPQHPGGDRDSSDEEAEPDPSSAPGDDTAAPGDQEADDDRPPEHADAGEQGTGSTAGKAAGSAAAEMTTEERAAEDTATESEAEKHTDAMETCSETVS